MIRNVFDRETALVWFGERSRKLPLDIQERALVKLRMLNAALALDELHYPRSNRLHELKDDRAGPHSVSINKQWRMCFVRRDEGAERVEITDYH